tara:strand:- start:437 stop:838 length:402 start_codon:yes stop_codon:yes gene_type:complete
MKQAVEMDEEDQQGAAEKKMKGRICHHCHKMGHYIADCEEYNELLRIAQEEAERNEAAGDRDYRRPPFSKSASSKAKPPTSPTTEEAKSDERGQESNLQVSNKGIILTKRAPMVLKPRPPLKLIPRKHIQEKK